MVKYNSDESNKKKKLAFNSAGNLLKSTDAFLIQFSAWERGQRDCCKAHKATCRLFGIEHNAYMLL